MAYVDDLACSFVDLFMRRTGMMTKCGIWLTGRSRRNIRAVFSVVVWSVFSMYQQILSSEMGILRFGLARGKSFGSLQAQYAYSLFLRSPEKVLGLDWAEAYQTRGASNLIMPVPSGQSLLLLWLPAHSGMVQKATAEE